MIYFLIPVLAVLILLILFFSTLIITVAGFKPTEGKVSLTVNSDRIFQENDVLSIITWNLGYAGLGEESNFIADGGKSILPPSREIVQKNIINIASFLQENSADIWLLQEVAKKSRLIFNLDIWQRLTQNSSEYNYAHSPTVKIPWFPIVGRLITGNAIFSIFQPYQVLRHNLPLEEKGFLGIFQQKYNFMSAHFDLPSLKRQLIVVNLHLAAFDEGGKIRKKQLEKLRIFLLTEYEKGNYLIVGGDWNHRLTDTDFITTTEEKYLFWVHDLPADFTPAGWQWAFDETVPTVRTLERSYQPQENYTCIIDGFLLSPNLELLAVKGYDQQFKYSDHQPVRVEIKLRSDRIKTYE